MQESLYHTQKHYIGSGVELENTTFTRFHLRESFTSPGGRGNAVVNGIVFNQLTYNMKRIYHPDQGLVVWLIWFHIIINVALFLSRGSR